MKFIYVALFAFLAFQAVSARPAENNSFSEKLNSFTNQVKDYLQNGLQNVEKKYKNFKENVKSLVNDVKEKLEPALEKSQGAVKEKLQKLKEKLQGLEVKGVDTANKYTEKVKELVKKGVEQFKGVENKFKDALSNNKACAQQVKPHLAQYKEQLLSQVKECGKLAGERAQKLYNTLKNKAQKLGEYLDNVRKGHVSEKDGNNDVKVDAKTVDDEAHKSESTFKSCVASVYQATKKVVQEVSNEVKSCLSKTSS